MPLGSTSKLVRACLHAGDEAAAAEALGAADERAADGLASLDGALDLVHSLARQELQHERAEAARRRTAARADAIGRARATERSRWPRLVGWSAWKPN